jgi:hypothetical protein
MPRTSSAALLTLVVRRKLRPSESLWEDLPPEPLPEDGRGLPRRPLEARPRPTPEPVPGPAPLPSPQPVPHPGPAPLPDPDPRPRRA